MQTATRTKTTNQHGYTYQAALAASQKVNWRIEDIFGGADWQTALPPAEWIMFFHEESKL
jgi:hypothetical protein